MSYYDVFHHRRQRASTESLMSMLRSLEAPIKTLRDVPSALREKSQAIWRRPLEPVIIAWDKRPARVEIRLPASAAGAALDYHLKLENGEERRGRWSDTDGIILRTAETQGMEYVLKRLTLPGKLPWGYHRLTLELPGIPSAKFTLSEANVLRAGSDGSLVISAPTEAYLPEGETDSRMWGAFLPLYALRTARDWGSGDFSGLEEMMLWAGSLGGRVVATLPLLATFLDGDASISPYLPVSRLLWNEFYLDINRIPELAGCPPAQRLISTPSFQERINAQRAMSLVDYLGTTALKRQALEELSRHFFSNESRRLEDLWRFTETHPGVDDYAGFRAVREKQGCSWRSWPQPLRDGVIKEGDFDEESRRYHLYVQWLAHQQMEAVSKTAREKGLQLYLDFPLGVHPDGYDVWRQNDIFIHNAQTGAPPDTVFTRGQHWGFPLLHPQKIREQGYRYLIACLRHHLEYAGALRIDHVMGFHRLYCIPDGIDSTQGVYLRYRAEEYYAILALESQRHRAMIVGEDLGNVPGYVRPAMKKHGLQRMYVLRYELAEDIRSGIHPVPADSVASLNTHDMPPFASFWQGLDIEERLKLGLLDGPGAQRERDSLPNMKMVVTTFLKNEGWLKDTEDNLPAIIKACLAFLAASPTRIVLVNLEDLWLETRPQNVPSTSTEYPNWQHKAQSPLEEFYQMYQVLDILWTVNELRQRVR
ncbi:MAG: 4-alpha-glucanotransferase [Chloroflexi bacterium]|nr:4-alpha-glucanotransferase [Chloroflexota bacterium]